MKIETVPYYSDGKIYQRTIIMEIPEKEWEECGISKIIKKMKRKYKGKSDDDGFTESNKRRARKRANEENGKDPEPFVTEQEFLQNIMELSGMESRNFRMAKKALVIGIINMIVVMGWTIFFFVGH